ncbi:HEAT repeat domain-containing protein [Oligoflexus tunisiensis]|uniref:HEAT repeat domain-containing protein n=1 Tax=Oligoflexus tunisiensis TaxID=708132 RepID=UPI00159F122D|nr:HEAT repeat domain-containing protein [Oligoflexus tunisiensis]
MGVRIEKKWRMAAGLFLLALAVGFGLYWKDGRFHASAGQEETYVIDPGTQFVYHFHYESQGLGQSDVQGTSDRATPIVPKTEVDVAVEGRLYLKLLESEKDVLIFEMHLKPDRWRFASGGLSLPKPTDDFAGWLRMSPRGRIEGFQSDEVQYQEYSMLLADLLSLVDLELPVQKKTKWASQAQSFQGASPVTILLKNRSGSRLTLEKIYGSTSEQHIQGVGQHEIDLHKFWKRVDVTRERQTTAPRGSIARDRSRLQLKSIAEAWDREAPRPEKLSISETMSGENYQRLVERDMHRRELKGRGWDEIQALMEDLPRLTQQQRVEPYLALKAFIYFHPEQIGKLREYLDLPYKDPRCSTVAAALTAVGNRAAQELLMQAIDASQAGNQEKFIAHLGLVEHIEESAEQRMHELARDLTVPRNQRAAELAIGVMGSRHLRHGRADGLQRSLDYARQKLSTADSDRDTQHALRILGNIGAPDQVAWIVPYLQSEKEETRREALRAMRSVQDDRAYSILLTTLQQSPSERLRETAIENLNGGAQDQRTFETLKNVLVQERNDRIIRQIVSHLANMNKTHPEVRQLLADYLENCGRTDVCGFVSSVLASL